MALTKENIQDAEKDLNTIASVVNGGAGDNGDGSVTSRLGRKIKTLSRVISDLAQQAAAQIISMGYQPPVVYAAGIVVNSATQTVTYNQNQYAPIPQQLPFTTGATFDPSKWRMVVAGQRINLRDYTTPQQAATFAEGLKADVYIPNGTFTGNIDDTTDTLLEGDGKMFNSANVQTSTYAEPRSRFVIGQEYLWAFHAAVINNQVGVKIDCATSGDSTTRGAFGKGNLPTKFQLDQLLQAHLNERYGITGPVIVNRATSGLTTREWIGAPAAGRIVLSDDMTALPNLSLYILRWGLNDGSFGNGYHDIAQFRSDLRTALTRIRAWRGVDKLSIVLMTPSTTSETGYRDEAWHEDVARIIKKAARDFKCCYIDCYGIWRDARSGVNLWLDSEGAGGSGIHPDLVFNHWIANTISDVVFAPLGVSNRATNTFINASGLAIRIITPNVPPEAFNMGVSIFRTNNPSTFPLDGILRVTRSADGVVMQEVIGFAASAESIQKRTYTRYGSDGNGWSMWRGMTYNPALQNGWANYAIAFDAPSYRKTVDGTVHVAGRVKNAGTVEPGSVICVLPVGVRPTKNSRFMVWDAAGTGFGVLEIQTDGSLVYFNGNKADLTFSFSYQALD